MLPCVLEPDKEYTELCPGEVSFHSHVLEEKEAAELLSDGSVWAILPK